MIRALIIILVYIVGPVAVLVWAFKRYKHGIKPSFGEASIVIIAIFLMVASAYFTTWKVTNHGNEQMVQLLSQLIQNYDFPVKAKNQDRPAVDGIARPNRFVIHVYGVISRKEQDKVVSVLKKLHRQIASKPIVVYFFQAEVWTIGQDGTRHPHRDREELLRTVRVE
jgi:hypothetical protein